MITFWNRREIVCTFDMYRQALIRGVLSDNRINYHVLTRNHDGSYFGGGRGRMGHFGQSQNINLEYRIFVHKSDYERALSLISSLN